MNLLKCKQYLSNDGYWYSLGSFIFSFFTLQSAVFYCHLMFNGIFSSSAFSRYLDVALDMIIPCSIIFLLSSSKTKLQGLETGLAATLCYELASLALKCIAYQQTYSFYMISADFLSNCLTWLFLLCLVARYLLYRLTTIMNLSFITATMTLFSIRLYYLFQWYAGYLDYQPLRYAYIAFLVIIAIGLYLDMSSKTAKKDLSRS